VDLLEEAWLEFLQSLQNEHSPLLAEMNELGIPVSDLFKNLCEMREFPDVEWEKKPVDKPNLVTSYNKLMEVVKEARPSVPDKEPKRGYDALQDAILVASRKARFLDPSNEKEIISVFELFDKKLKPTQNRWDSKEDAKFYEGKFNDVLEKHIKPRLQEWRKYCHPKVVTFLQAAMEAYIQLKKVRSMLNFQDLLLSTTNLLRENAEVRKYFQTKYRYLFVDEFQDTDPIQAEMMFYLTSEEPTEKVWSKCKPKRGSLFVVGDPKQAIYRFRRADIDTYNRVKQLIEENGGEVLQLTMNFRTLDSVTKGLNNVFHSHLPEIETVYQATYRPLHSFKKDTGGELSGIKKLTVPGNVTKKDDIIVYDAEQIATTIKQLIAQGYKARDLMVLTRYNEGISTYSEKIENKGIPVSISGEVVIGEMREFQELSILLKTFVDPTDEVSLLATLRGIFFGVSDNELYQWRMNGGRFSLYSEVASTLPEQLSEKLELVFSKLRQYQKWVRAYSPTIAIEKIMEDVGFYPLLLQQSGNNRFYKSLLQIIEALRKWEIEGKTTYKQVFQLLSEMVFEKTVVINIEEDTDAVRVMNIHKAKGLEAKVVFLAHPAKFVKQDAFLTKHIKRKDDSSKGYFAFTTKKGFQLKEVAIPLYWDDYKQEELNYLLAEELRILYVASTRPEQALMISSSAKGDKNNPWALLLELPDIEELNVQIEENEEIQSREEVTLADYQTRTVGMTEWLGRRKKKTYDYWSPTKGKDYSEVAAIEREEGGGKDWGTVIHHVFEKVVKGKDVTNYIPSLLLKYGFPIEKEQEVIKAIEALEKSDFWQELKVAEKVLTEVPFVLTISKEHKLYELMPVEDEGEHPYFVKGVIDLVYKIDGVWKIVDYKTDHPKDGEHFKDLEDFYQNQILFYKKAWEEMTGGKVASEKLFFVMQR
jgi:ATP-dependent helicase/nuclease subunit A